MLRYHSNHRNSYLNSHNHLSSISRTARYKKFTKPLLERKRRARMNRCVEELKLLFGNVEAEGENINKLEKADVLEMTVRYIKRISNMKDPVQEAHRFHAGFSECASEACKFLRSLPSFNSAVSSKLVEHLENSLAKSRPCVTNFLPYLKNLESAKFKTSCTSNFGDSSRLPKPNDDNKLPTRQQQRHSTYKPVFESSHRYGETFTLNKCTTTSMDDQKKFMWRPW